MDVAIIVIAAFFVLLLLIIAAVRMCIKYHCIIFCDQNVESIDVLEIEGDVDMSESFDNEDESCGEIFNDDQDVDIDSGEKDEEEEALNCHEPRDVTRPIQGNFQSDSEQSATDCESDECTTNRLQESLL